jgi:hypothetical protein
MDETDLRLDGNAVAGMLAEVFGFEMTAEWGGCAGCGAHLLRVARGEGRWWLDLRGLAWLQLDEQARVAG